MNDKPETKIGYVSPLKRICMTIGELPTSYLETMSYYEMLIWFTKFLQEKVIPTIDNNAQAVEELQHLFIELQSYVNNYFDNLDVQDEINNKLDQMLEDGVLEQIIEQYLNSSAIWGFDTVADMKAATNLIDGSYARTLGYYTINDGGKSIYKITNIESETEYQEELNNGLYATLIKTSTLNPIMFGCVGDNLTDDSVNFLKCIKSFNDIEIDLLNKEYNLPTLNSFTFNKNTTIKNGTLNINEIIMRNKEGILNLENVKIHAKSLTDAGINQKFIIFGETNDTGSYILNNCEITAENYNAINNKVCLLYLKDYTKCEITNCYFENKHINTEAGGCLWFTNSKESEKILIKNSRIINSSKDECLAIYNYYNIKSNIIENNYFKSNYAVTYMVTLFNLSGEVNKFISNTFESFTHELSIRSTGDSKVEILNNLFIHDASLQIENSKSGIHSTNSNCIIKGNKFNFINCNNAGYTIIPINAPNCILFDSYINYDNNDTHNGTGIAQEFDNCYFNNIYNIQRKLVSCNIKTPLGRLNGGIQAYNCNFNMESGVNGGYAQADILFKNCNGGIFTNNAVATSLIIENSSVNYSNGTLENLTNSQTRLNSACNSGHIYFSSMNNVVIENIIKS